jgi:translation elongation factor EF-4
MKSLGQKLIKIDILLSHVKLNKMSMVTHSSKEKKLPKKIMQKKSDLEAKTDHNRENRKLNF